MFLNCKLQVQNGVQDFSRFQRIVKMLAFHPFDSAENALENMHSVTEHELTEDLRVSQFICIENVQPINFHLFTLPLIRIFWNRMSRKERNQDDFL